jgi:hypothetical protein
MFKETCLVDPRRTPGTPRKLGLEDPRATVLAQRRMAKFTFTEFGIQLVGSKLLQYQS